MKTVSPTRLTKLDADFVPAILAHRNYESYLDNATDAEDVAIGLEREDGLLSRFETRVSQSMSRTDTFRYVERLIKFLLWSRGGWKIHWGGPAWIGKALQSAYAPQGERTFDAHLMQNVYGRAFTIEIMRPDDVPAERQAPLALGGHMDGCRIGFDLGASDFKLAAVQDGEVLFSDEIPWNPKDQADPMYHYHHLSEGLKKAAKHLPRVDAIGGSTAGVVVNNEMRVASLFRSIPADRYGEASGLFKRLQEEWQVPFEVINDGEVTALAGALSLGVTAVLGLAMGSSEAVGYLSRKGRITGWLDELAFAPVDFNPDAPPDEWSGDRGVGALYFSQQAVNKLAPAAEVVFDDDLPLPSRLKEVQRLMQDGNELTGQIYHTIGTYLGYSLPWYGLFYDMSHVLVLGRVLSGPGGTIIIDQANEVLQSAFPEWAERLTLHVPDEKMRRVGQAVAAASLPVIR